MASQTRCIQNKNWMLRKCKPDTECKDIKLRRHDGGDSQLH